MGFAGLIPLGFILLGFAGLVAVDQEGRRRRRRLLQEANRWESRALAASIVEADVEDRRKRAMARLGRL